MVAMTRGCHQHFTYSRAVRSKTNKRNEIKKVSSEIFEGENFVFLIPIGVFPRRFLFECDFVCLRASGMLEYVGCSFVHHLLHWRWTKHCNFMFRIQRFFLARPWATRILTCKYRKEMEGECVCLSFFFRFHFIWIVRVANGNGNSMVSFYLIFFIFSTIKMFELARVGFMLFAFGESWRYKWFRCCASIN